MKMDTRTKKIVPVEEAARMAAEGATIVSGYFDPLCWLRTRSGCGR